MKICLTGHSGFIGKHIFDFFKDKHSVVKINLRNIQTKKDFKNFFFLSNFEDANFIINCAANLNPKTQNDFFINQEFPKLMASYIGKNIKNCFFIQISTINVLIKDRKDCYTKSKIIAEEGLKNTRSIIVRLPLIYETQNDQIINGGNLSIFFDYLSLKLPFYPMIYPGQVYEPLTINLFLNFLNNLISKENICLKYFSLSGGIKKNTYEIFQEIASSKNKNVVKLNIHKLLPNFLIKFFLKKNGFLQQLTNIDNSNFKKNKQILS